MLGEYTEDPKDKILTVVYLLLIILTRLHIQQSQRMSCLAQAPASCCPAA